MKNKNFLVGKIILSNYADLLLEFTTIFFLGLSDGTPGKGIYVPVRSFAYEINRYED